MDNSTALKKPHLNLVDMKPDAEKPAILIAVLNRKGEAIHTAKVDDLGEFKLPSAAVLKKAHQIVIGSSPKGGNSIDIDSALRYHPEQFDQYLQTGVLDISRFIWERWIFQHQCVSGRVSKCNRSAWWYHDLAMLANPEPKPSATQPRRQRVSPARSPQELLAWPSSCEPICSGSVEVYRRRCCCSPWVTRDPRIQELIDELTRLQPEFPDFWPESRLIPPQPPEGLELAFFRDGTLHEMALNAQADLKKIRNLPHAGVAEYINARPYLSCYSDTCNEPVRVAETALGPDGGFSTCWRTNREPSQPNCRYEYSYVVKQPRNGESVVIYNGLAANTWFSDNEEPNLKSYHARAYACRNNGGAGTGAYVMLDLIGETESWQIKTPAQSGWSSVISPQYNDGLAHPATSRAAAIGKQLNRNWGGILKLNFLFSEDMQSDPVKAKYYRLSVTAADDNGNPTGARHYYDSPLIWEKLVTVAGGTSTEPKTLGPFTRSGAHHLYEIPFDDMPSGKWHAGQFHAFLDTTDSRWNDPEHRHMLTLEVFDSAGKLIRPEGTAASDQVAAQRETAFTFKWRQQERGPHTDVGQAALTHMFWWDNRAPHAKIEGLNKNGVSSNSECQFLVGDADTTLGVRYRAYHPQEMFQLAHSISWTRGLGNTDDSSGSLLTESSSNVGQPPSQSGDSPANTFEQMLAPDVANPPRSKCTFSLSLGIKSKTTDGDDLGATGVFDYASFALEIDS